MYTITEIERRYGLADPGLAWYLITTGAIVTSPEGELVRLEADPDKRIGTLWQVEEVPA